MKIKKYIISILVIYSILNSCASKSIIGKYETNFPLYGMFGKSLTINCDSTFVLNFNGDLMNDNSYGNWEIKEDTLILKFDTINYPNSRYKETQKYIIKRKKLMYCCLISKKKYNKIVALIEKEKLKDRIKILSYSDFNKKFGIAPANFEGKMKLQFFKKIKKIKCDK